MSRSVFLKAALEAYKAQTGASYRSIAMRAGIPVRSLMGILEGHAPSIDRAAECARRSGWSSISGRPGMPAANRPRPLHRNPGMIARQVVVSRSKCQVFRTPD